ncbi:PC4 and SFRS1-interacting protein-like [Schistocerca nitens]|uniref:PC4 and SFRS1-interacting protein-like n=1 Tax=Schistocerca nitens TaxID=7011 RepID=UPI002118C112|nr:PC4 and SFRS1-interacting protein-like [Schistocerca nitens]XP_049811206.1 PC4 and SFRS1-interacting protein-like [Schistocerca nitens]XP_049811207.1 PC4 and SFRS1-interacting protein-like [Schistocerca nitens]
MAGPFKKGDKVFAKVRGYPPWPAHVQCLAEATNNKLKYHVIFYGTYETAVCKAEDMFPYVENKERFGRPLKRKGFNEALAQIENGVNDKLFETKCNEDSESDWESDFNQTSPESQRASKSSEQTEGNSVNQRSSKILKSADKLNSKKSLNESTSPSSQGEAQRVSRSGRKIKPKKFADDEITGTGIITDNSEHSVRAVGGSYDQNKSNVLPNNYTLSNIVSEDNAAGSEDDQVDFCRTGRSHQFPVSHKRKSSLQTGTAEGDNTIFKPHVELSEPPVQNALPSIGTTRLTKIKQLQTVSQLLCLDALIKASTCCSKAKLENCVKYLTELANLPVDCNTLKRCPQIVVTVRKLTKYLGNTTNLETPVSEGGKATEKIFLIQYKSQQIYNKYKAMFTNFEKDVSSSTYLNNVDYSHRHSFSSETGSSSASEVFPAVISQPGPSNTVIRKLSTRGRKIGKPVAQPRLSRIVGRPAKFIRRSVHHSRTTNADNRRREDVENWPPSRDST